MAMAHLTPVTQISAGSNRASAAISRTSPHTVFRRLFESSENHDFDAVAATIHEECEWMLMSSGEIFKGRKNIVALCKSGKLASGNKPEIIFDVANAEWGVFEYMSRGVITDAFANLAAASGWRFPFAPAALVGRRYALPVCIVYHTNAQRKIYLLQEYLDLGSLPNQFL
jgi:hypothetical protein